MPAFLVTGNPGSGKSTVAKELAHRGYRAVDSDYDAELSYWENDAGQQVMLADGPREPDAQWLRTHRWVWSRARLIDILSHEDRPVFVCGIALNLDQVVDLFDRVFVLQIDAATQGDRLRAHDALNPPGRTEAGREEIRAGRLVFEAQMRTLGATPINGAAPTAAVADDILACLALE